MDETTFLQCFAYLGHYGFSFQWIIAREKRLSQRKYVGDESLACDFKMSSNASLRFSHASLSVHSWVFTPGISSTQAVYHCPRFSNTAVDSRFIVVRR